MDKRRHTQQEAWSGAVGQDVQDVTADLPTAPASPGADRTPAHPPAAPHPPNLGSVRLPRLAPRFPQSQHHPSSTRPARRRMVIASLVTVALLVALTSGALWLLNAPLWQVHTVRVVGTSDPAVISAIQRLSLANCDIFRCDTAAAARHVEALPQVAHAQVSPAYPDALVVTVRLRQPTLLWRSGDSAIVVASDGVSLGDPASDPALTHAPLTTVIERGSTSQIAHNLSKNGRMDAAIATMAPQVREVNQQVFNGAAMLSYDDGEGFALTTPTGLHVVFGTPADTLATWADVTSPSSSAGTSDLSTANATNPQPQAIARALALQAAELRGILAYLAQQGQQATVIDLRWGAHPYYRLAGA